MFTIARRSLALALCSLLPCGHTIAQQGRGFRIAVVEGEGAIHNIRAAKSVELRVQLQADGGRPLPRVPVTFVLPTGGPGGSFVDGSNTLTVLSGKDGLATARGFRPNSKLGQFPIRVNATYRGELARVTIMQTNAAPAEKSFRKTVLVVALIGAAVFGVAVLVSAVSNSPKPRNDTPFGPSQ